MKVMAFGTFDVIHPGHEYYLNKSKTFGHLTVVVARDSTVEKVKGRLPLNNEKERLNAVKKLRIADKVILGYEDEPLRIVLEIKPDVLCFGYDQTAFTEEAERAIQNSGETVRIIRIESFRPEIYKSSLIKK